MHRRPNATLIANGTPSVAHSPPSHRRYDRHPGYLRLLSRLGGGTPRRWPYRRGGAGGTLHPHAARRRVPDPRHRLLSRRGGPRCVGPRLRGLLRQAAPEVRAAARDLPGLRAARLRVIRARDAAVAQTEATPAPGDPSLARGRLSQEHHLHRAPRVARRQRVLHLALRGRRDPDTGRRRRVGHGQLRSRARASDRADTRAAISALAGAPLLRLHVSHGVQGQLRRIQAHGAGPIR